MRLIGIILLLFMTYGGWAESMRPEVSIRANEALQVTAGLPVLIADVATLESVSPVMQEKVGNLVLLEAMASGEEKSYSSGELVRLLKQKIKEDSELSSLNWSYFVSDGIRIKAAADRLPEKRITSQINTALKKKCETCTFRLKNLRVPAWREKSTIVDLDLETVPLKLAGSFVLPLRITTGEGEKSAFVTGSVVTMAKALVPARTIQMGEKIESADVKTEEVEIRFTNDAFATLSDLKARVASRALTVGRPVMMSDLKKELVITKGQVIRAVSGNDLFEVSVSMQAEESGGVGDLIRLKNTETQKLMSGQVVDRGLVRIQ